MNVLSRWRSRVSRTRGLVHPANLLAFTGIYLMDRRLFPGKPVRITVVSQLSVYRWSPLYATSPCGCFKRDTCTHETSNIYDNTILMKQLTLISSLSKRSKLPISNCGRLTGNYYVAVNFNQAIRRKWGWKRRSLRNWK